MLRLTAAVGPKTFWMPESASTVAPAIDWLYYFVYWVNVFFFLLIAVLMVWFCIKYRHRPGVKRSPTAGHSTALELTWTIIPTILVLIIYYYAFRTFLGMSVEPPNAYEVTATGRMWNWSFTYPNGVTDGELHVPAGVPVRVVLQSEDVIHSLFMPTFRIKKDVVPGRYNRIWFQAEKKDGPQEDIYPIYCAAYCGQSHSAMLSQVHVHTQADFNDWMTKASNRGLTMTPIQWGSFLYTSRGCVGCHSVDGSRITGPSWKDMFGSTVPIEGIGPVPADDDYVRESIQEPQAKIHAGYPNVMPSFKNLKPAEINAIAAYMKSISVNFHGDLRPLNTIGGGSTPTSGPTTAPAGPTTAPTTAPVARADRSIALSAGQR